MSLRLFNDVLTIGLAFLTLRMVFLALMARMTFLLMRFRRQRWLKLVTIVLLITGLLPVLLSWILQESTFLVQLRSLIAVCFCTMVALTASIEFRENGIYFSQIFIPWSRMRSISWTAKSDLLSVIRIRPEWMLPFSFVVPVSHQSAARTYIDAARRFEKTPVSYVIFQLCIQLLVATVVNALLAMAWFYMVSLDR
ncbi:MAG: hypothetical protein KDB22_20210 [Planctomycetales bacterium]|nr:hypothetical protein [Planctomycetales bacterium]